MGKTLTGSIQWKAHKMVRPGPLRVYNARKVYTMDETLPEATHIAVADGRIVAVGGPEAIAPWARGRAVIEDVSLRGKIVMPGFIDNHLHPFLGALVTPMEIIAPEPWRMANGDVWPAANSPEEYLGLLRARLAARRDTQEVFITFGYQPAVHGRLARKELDEIAPDRPVILWQRSFHESYLNTKAIERLGLTTNEVAAHPQANVAAGHFYETGNFLVLQRLLPEFLRPEWYHKGLNTTLALLHQGGVTTAADMLFGGLSPEFELAALEACVEKAEKPVRIVNVFDARGFARRAANAPPGPHGPDEPLNFAAGFDAMRGFKSKATRRIRFANAAKLFADGAIFSALMQMDFPGYVDGHHGEWLMSPEVLAQGVEACWREGFQIHCHVNGDLGMNSVIAALEAAQAAHPRFDHRFTVHHVGFHTNAQSRRLGTLGAHASVNPYYIYALSDAFSDGALGPERGRQLVRCGSLIRNDVSVSFHSDFLMAPIEPLLLAWCAAARTTRSGKQVSPTECMTLQQALRGITIDAAFAIKMDHEIGSLTAGKKADFTVLEDDPFDLGVERLKEARVAGVVFEGEWRPLDKPTASVFASTALPLSKAPLSAPHGPACCEADGDPCTFLRRLGGLAAEHFLRAA
jgi:hypothetical protein